MKKALTIFALAIAASTTPLITGHAAAAPVYVGIEGENVAVGGYDVVSYFQGDGVPVKGAERFTVEYDGAEWHFSSQQNADAFEQNPDAYAPQYGGHCAWAMARGSLAPGDPTVYRIVDGKLYLNFNKQVQDMWLKDIAGFISKADIAWTDIPEDASFGG